MQRASYFREQRREPTKLSKKEVIEPPTSLAVPFEAKTAAMSKLIINMNVSLHLQ